MTRPDRPRSARNVVAAFTVLVAVLALSLIPAYCRDQVEPEAFYRTAAEARRAPDAAAWLPAFVPPEARAVWERHGRYRRFVRFTVDSAAAARMTAGMVALDTARARAVPVPVSGWSPWWQLAPQTLQGGQGKQVRVYRVESPPRDRGYLVLDPRTGTGYYWSTDR